MSQIELSYMETKKELIKEIKKRQYMVLATSEEDVVMARTVLFISDGLSVFFIMRPATRKYTQIAANPNVAVAAGNLQIEGNVRSRGRPFAEENKALMDILRETNPKVYEHAAQSYPQRPEYELFEVVPRRIALYKTPLFNDVPESYWEILYVEREEAYRVTTRDAEISTVYRE